MKNSKPYYPYPAISSLQKLAKTLSIEETFLTDIISKVDQSYTDFSITPENKKERTVHEPKYNLKKIQKRINSRILELVQYPLYLNGGIKDPTHPRDYIKNATIHCGQQAIINLDIKNFYPNIREEYVYDIFKYLFKFPKEVASALTALTTYKGKVPQGACCSSYIANLVFFNSEYTIESQLTCKGYKYSRLLDDITISSSQEFSETEKTFIISSINALFKKYQLSQNNKKRTIESKSNPNKAFTVTGVWVGNNAPKIRKTEKHLIRHLVYICEQEYKKCPHSDEYHKLWNKASGKVAKLTRLQHKQAKNLRLRLYQVLPIHNEGTKRNLIINVKNLLKVKPRQAKRPGHVAKVNKLLFQIGILARTDKLLAKSLRQQLAVTKLPTKKELWESNDY